MILTLVLVPFNKTNNEKTAMNGPSAKVLTTKHQQKVKKTVDIVYKKWIDLAEAIAMVESKQDSTAISKSGVYVGYLQMAPICVNEVNRILKEQNKDKQFTYNDRLSREKSIEMFIIFQEYHNSNGDKERAIRLWNSGDRKCMERKHKTESYYRKVMEKYTALACY